VSAPAGNQAEVQAMLFFLKMLDRHFAYLRGVAAGAPEQLDQQEVGFLLGLFHGMGEFTYYERGRDGTERCIFCLMVRPSDALVDPHAGSCPAMYMRTLRSILASAKAAAEAEKSPT